jgi:hypothetical protein
MYQQITMNVGPIASLFNMEFMKAGRFFSNRPSIVS